MDGWIDRFPELRRWRCGKDKQKHKQLIHVGLKKLHKNHTIQSQTVMMFSKRLENPSVFLTFALRCWADFRKKKKQMQKQPGKTTFSKPEQIKNDDKCD